MPEHSTTSTVLPPPTTNTLLPSLLGVLRDLLFGDRSAFRQERTFLRAQALLFGHLFAFARHTITQALVALGLTDHDWSAFYRLFGAPRVDYEELTCCFFRQTLEHMPSTEPYVAVVDGVQLPRSSNKMPGTSWLKCPRTPPFKPGPHRAQRFLHLAALLPNNEQGYSRALPLRFEPAFPEKAVEAEGFEPKKQWEAASEAIGWLRAELDEAGRSKQRLLVLGDGDFSFRPMFMGTGGGRYEKEGWLVGMNNARCGVPCEASRKKWPKKSVAARPDRMHRYLETPKSSSSRPLLIVEVGYYKGRGGAVGEGLGEVVTLGGLAAHVP